MPYIKLITYGSNDYKEMIRLREAILRKPLGLHFTPEYLQQEINDILIGCFITDMEEEKIVGCCVLTPIDDDMIQLRQMAVDKEFQRSGIGKEILTFAENHARERGYNIMMMHARKVAVGFYEHAGYKLYGDEFLEVSIPHFEMRKNL